MAFQELFMEMQDCGVDLHSLSHCINSLCNERAFCLAALKIRNCNAGTGHGINFSHACCDTVVCSDNYYPFGTVFIKGFKLLHEVFTNKKYIPEDEASAASISRLLTYLCDKESKEFLLKLQTLKKKNVINNKASLTVALAEHLLSKLSRKSDYILDYTSLRRNDDMCKCGCGTNVDNKFDDNSIGNSSVWHGYLDLLIGEGELPVVVCEPGDSDTSTRNIPIKVQYQSDESDINNVKEQILAQTIVFSFYQRKKHPNLSHFLVPCIGITSQSIMFCFYDCEHDILLQTPELDMITSDGRINYSTLIAIWMVVNYKDLCTGLTDDLLEAQKSEFFDIVDDHIDIYRDAIALGNVHDSYRGPRFNPSSDASVPFVWPPNVPQYEIPTHEKL